MVESLSADVVIVGAGVAGGMMAADLAAHGVSVLLLESGPAIDRNAAMENFLQSPTKGPNSPYPVTSYAPQPDDTDWGGYYVQKGPDPFYGLYLRAVGGTTWHWGGFVQRFRPSDLRMHTLYGRGVDWPIDYDTLEPWYERAETEIGVSGSNEILFGGPRRNGYPMPEIPATYLDTVVAAAVRGLNLTTAPFPQARVSVEDGYDGRPQCLGNATCVPLCPVQAKYDGSVHTDKAVAAGARLEAQTVVHTLVEGDGGRIAAALYRRSDGTEGRAEGRIVVVAANAIESAKLLLMSRTDSRPGGIANGSGAVGRYLMSQIDLGSRALTRDPVFPYRGPVMTSGFLEFRDGDFRKDHAAVGTSLSNAGWTRARGPMIGAMALAGAGASGAELAHTIADRATRELVLGSSAETLPDPDNRVVLSDQTDGFGLPRPEIHYRIDDYARAGLDLAVKRHEQVFQALGATEIRHDPPGTSTAILLGTARMGSDPKQSVVDADLRSHDHPNLFIVGGSAFPTVSCSQPTLTIAALALRAAAQVRADLGADTAP